MSLSIIFTGNGDRSADGVLYKRGLVNAHRKVTPLLRVTIGVYQVNLQIFHWPWSYTVSYQEAIVRILSMFLSVFHVCLAALLALLVHM
jgi:hypothetical protein